MMAEKVKYESFQLSGRLIWYSELPWTSLYSDTIQVLLVLKRSNLGRDVARMIAKVVYNSPLDLSETVVLNVDPKVVFDDKMMDIRSSPLLEYNWRDGSDRDCYQNIMIYGGNSFRWGSGGTWYPACDLCLRPLVIYSTIRNLCKKRHKLQAKLYMHGVDFEDMLFGSVRLRNGRVVSKHDNN